MSQYFLVLTSFGLVSASVLFSSAAQAHHRSGHGGGPPHRVQQGSAQQETVYIEPVDFRTSPLTTAQRTAITSLFQETNDDYTIISRELRQDIRAQFNSLPPGIQRRLAQGRGLPPGIAKKIYLPTQVNRRIDLDDNVRIVVIDRNVVVVDPVTELVVDILRNVLL